MSSWSALEQSLMSALSLPRRPVAVTFRDAVPSGVARFSGTEPSGCSFWRLAAAGQAFYTVPADHYNCPIGSHTHGIKLPAPARRRARADAHPHGRHRLRAHGGSAGHPALPKAPGAVVYAPLGDTPLDPDVVLVAGRPGRLMLLLEAAGRAGVATQPGCSAALPAWRCRPRWPAGRSPAPVHRQPRLHRSRRRRALRHHPWSRPGPHRGRAGHDRESERHPRRLPPRPPEHTRHAVARRTPRVRRAGTASHRTFLISPRGGPLDRDRRGRGVAAAGDGGPFGDAEHRDDRAEPAAPPRIPHHVGH